MHKVLFDERQNYLLNVKGLRHSKKFIQGLDIGRSKQILRLKRNETRLITAALTGHFRLNAYLFMIGARADDWCRFCNLHKENMEHLLCECNALERRRNKIPGHYTCRI